MTKETRDSTTMDSSALFPPEIHLKSNLGQNDDDTIITFEQVNDLYKDQQQGSWKEENGLKLLRPHRNLFTREVTVIPQKIVDAPSKKGQEGLLEKVWKALNLIPEDYEDYEEKDEQQVYRFTTPSSTPIKSNNPASLTKTILSTPSKKKLIWDPFLGELPAAPETMSVNDERVDYDSLSGTLRDANGNPLSFTESAPPKPALHLLFVHGSCSASSSFDDLLHSMHQQLTTCQTNTVDQNQLRNASTQNSKSIEKQLYQPENRQDEDHYETHEKVERCPSSCTDKKEQRIEDLLRLIKGRPIQFHLYDSFGCGNSIHPSTDWEAFSEDEITEDLQAMFASISSSSNNGDSSPIFLVGHAHGCSQIIHFLNGLDKNKEKTLPVDYERIKGAIFLSGALSDGPVEQISENSCSGGKCIWQLPNFVLDWIRPRLIANQSFLDTLLGPSAYDLKTTEDISFAKAYYSQRKWAASYEANKIKQRVLLIHGENDHVIPLSGGKHLDDHLTNSNLVVVRESSHLFFQENAETVSEQILCFISRQLFDPDDR